MTAICSLSSLRFRINAILVAAFVFGFISTSHAAPKQSRCLAVARAPVQAIPASLTISALKADEVRISFIGHSTFLIESPAGIKIATDYTGYAGPGILPNVVTMNRAHSSHFTDYPDPRIEHVLRGWNPEGGQASHNIEVGDVYIRNVPTDIRTFAQEMEVFGNSIFIFEVAGLCIGHLGHLHHELTPQHLGMIGHLDIVLVPVDRIYTMNLEVVMDVLKELRARIVIPMHYFDPLTLGEFIETAKSHFNIKLNEESTTTLSQALMPKKPEVLVLPGN